MPKNGSYQQTPLALFLLLVSCGLVSYQIYIIHLLSITQWNSFAALVISIALLGYGAAGSFLTVYKQKLLNNSASILPLLLVLSSILSIIAVRIALSDALAFDSYELFAHKKQIIKLLLTILLFTLPFFSGALSIGMIYSQYTKHISGLYFFDLLGAACGGVLILFLLNNFQLNQQLSIISVVLLLASVVFSFKTFYPGKLLLLGFCIVIISVNLIHPLKISFSQFKSVSYALDLPRAEVKWKKQSIYGYSQAIKSPSMRYAPGLSLNFTGNIPSCNTLFNNGNACGVYFDSLDSADNSFLKHSTIYLPFVIRKPGKTLILDADPGFYSLLKNEIDSLTVVVSNKNIKIFLENQLQKDIIHMDPHQYIQECDMKFDLILLPTIGSVGGGVGMDAFSEKHVLTVEAFSQLKHLLEPGGIMTISAWLENPVRAPYRLLSLISSNPAENNNHCIIGIKNWGLITYCFSNQNLSDRESARAKKFICENSFDLIVSNQSNLIPEARQSTDAVLIGNLKSIIESSSDVFSGNYGFRISAPDKNRPYFSQFLKFSTLISSPGTSENINPFLEVDYFIHGLMLLLVIVLAFLLIISPLMFIRSEASVNNWTFWYFISLGMGFMILEIVFIKVLSGYFFHPIIATTIVIALLLFSSGIGSLVSSKFDVTPNSIIRLNLIIGLLLFMNALFLISFIDMTTKINIIYKALFSILIIGVTGFFMGAAFPSGLKMLSTKNSRTVPWAWGINGITSVFAASATAFIIIETGFRLLFILSGSFYLVAAVTTWINRHNIK